MSRFQALSLYRKLLRLHQTKLPLEMRALGDRYVRQEFRSHKDANEDEFTQFMAQWHEYKYHLELESDLFGIGRDLPDGDADSLSDEQKQQLSKLKESAMRINPGSAEGSSTN